MYERIEKCVMKGKDWKFLFPLLHLGADRKIWPGVDSPKQLAQAPTDEDAFLWESSPSHRTPTRLITGCGGGEAGKPEQMENSNV